MVQPEPVALVAVVIEWVVRAFVMSALHNNMHGGMIELVTLMVRRREPDDFRFRFVLLH